MNRSREFVSRWHGLAGLLIVLIMKRSQRLQANRHRISPPP